MDRSIYIRMNAQETEHWWFRARRDIIRTSIERLVCLPKSPRILEAGCGTGGNLKTLMDFGHVDAFEYDEDARVIAEQKSGLPISAGALPDGFPKQEEKYDLIGLFDVLEHVKDDVGSLASLGKMLNNDGALVVTVPAFQWLWSRHDEMHHHFRRYNKAALNKIAQAADLEVHSSHYFNSFLFPVAIVMRLIKKLLRSNSPDDTMPSTVMNKLLYKVFSFERHFLGRLSFPAGLSVMVILKKRKKS